MRLTIGPLLLLLFVGAACAQGGELGEDDDDSTLSPTDAGADARTQRPDASSSSSSSSGGQSSGGTSSSSSGGGEDGGSSGGSSSGSSSSSGGPLTACQQALANILFDVEPATAPESGASWSVYAADGFQGDDSWPFQPWVFSTTTTPVIPTACAQGGCVGTSLTRNYVQCQRGWISTPIADLSACAGSTVVVKFDQAYSFNDYGTYKDGGIVEATGNGSNAVTATWTPLDDASMPGAPRIRGEFGGEGCLSPNSFYVNNKRGYVGTNATTHTVTLTLPASALTAQARVRFSFASGVAYAGTDPETSRDYTRFGWRVDNVRFEER